MPNARLTVVAGAGASEDYGRDSSVGASKWTGDEGIYLREKAERADGPTGTSLVVTRLVVAPADLGIDFASGDALTLTRDGDTVTETVRGVASDGRSVGVVKLILDDG